MAGITPESVLRSVRSFISLGSSRASRGSVKGNALSHQVAGNMCADGRSLDTNSSCSNLTNPDKPVVEAYLLANLKPIPKERSVDGI